MSAQDRHSKASEVELVSDPEEIARLEARNALQQFDAVTTLIERWTAPDPPLFRLRPSVLLHLQRIALEGLSPYAGNFRPSDILIFGSKHTPPHAYEVPELVDFEPPGDAAPGRPQGCDLRNQSLKGRMGMPPLPGGGSAMGEGVRG